jgi:hypothetical protein
MKCCCGAGAQIRPGGLAAFAVDVVGAPGAPDEEGLVIIVEVPKGARPGKADVAELAAAVRGTVMLHHAVAVHAVVVARPGATRRTTSGKVQRQASRAAYLAGEYAAGSADVLAVVGAGAGAGDKAGAAGEPDARKAGAEAGSESDRSSDSAISMEEAESGSDGEGGGGGCGGGGGAGAAGGAADSGGSSMSRSASGSLASGSRSGLGSGSSGMASGSAPDFKWNVEQLTQLPEQDQLAALQVAVCLFVKGCLGACLPGWAGELRALQALQLSCSHGRRVACAHKRRACSAGLVRCRARKCALERQ